jgi:death on curing protein
VKEPHWIDVRALMLLHAETLLEHGGLKGLRDEGALHSAMARPQNIFAYEAKTDIAQLAAAYAFGFVRSHPFNDGNKRVGFMSMGLFLAINGFEFSASESDATETFFKLAAGKLTEAKPTE